MIDIHHHYADASVCPYWQRYVEACLEVAAERGIDRLCISGLGEGYGSRGNREVERAFQAHPLFLGFGFVPLDSSGPDLVRDLAARGFRGLKFIGPAENYDSPRYFPVYETAAELGLVCLFHTGYVAPAFRNGSARMRPVYLDTVARRYPALTVIGAHLGMPWYEEALDTANTPNVYFDLSGRPCGLSAGFFRREFSSPLNFDKLLFGTDSMIRDFPIPQARMQELLDTLSVPESQRRGFWGGTAARLLNLAG